MLERPSDLAAEAMRSFEHIGEARFVDVESDLVRVG
jgi:hypothetical protein